MRRRWMVVAELIVLVGLGVWTLRSLMRAEYRPERAVEVKVQLPDARDKAYLFAGPDGSVRYRILTGGPEHYQDLTAEQFARRVYDGQQSRTPLERLLNVSSPLGFLWVATGFAGQALFTGRMLVQWLASERKKASVVPPVFWWMSLIGSSMLLAYFMWRQDPVGILGQAFGFFIYVRNLFLIHGPKPVTPAMKGPTAVPPRRHRRRDVVGNRAA